MTTTNSPYVLANSVICEFTRNRKFLPQLTQKYLQAPPKIHPASHLLYHLKSPPPVRLSHSDHPASEAIRDSKCGNLAECCFLLISLWSAHRRQTYDYRSLCAARLLRAEI